MNKRIAAIHDLSGFGKCSLTIILPILSACGLEACPLPTAFLSSHTGGLPGFTHRDLTPDLLPAARAQAFRVVDNRTLLGLDHIQRMAQMSGMTLCL